MRDFKKYWSKDFERILTHPKTEEDWGLVWGAVRGKFKHRSGNREGVLCTNHQGFIALNGLSHMIGKKEPALFHELDSSDGVTMPNELALVVTHALRAEAEFWFGGARAGLNRLSVLVVEALADAKGKNRNAIAVIDTTSTSIYGYSPSLRHEKDKRYHEAAHVWQYTVNPTNLGLISEEEMLADPDYPVLAREVGKFHKNPTPEVVYSEGAAWGIAGEGWNVGLYTKARAEGFLGRFFRAVKLRYGQEALDLLHLAHPHVRRVLDYVRSESVERNVGRREETTSGRAVESGNTGAADPGGAGGEIVGASRRDEVSSRSVGQRRDGGTDDRKGRLRSAFLGMGGFGLTGQLGGTTTIETAVNDDRALALTSALTRIASIDPSNPSERRLWPELGTAAVGMARDALENVAQSENGVAVSALREIAKMEPVHTASVRRSWKDVTEVAVSKARVALATISEGANVGTHVVIGAEEAAREVHRNERAPAPDISW